MITLTFLDKHVSGQAYELVQEKTTIGRSCPLSLKIRRTGSNHIVIPCESVPALHCEILVWADDIIVRDLDSANATFLDNVRLNKQSGARLWMKQAFGS